jgi:hypothetical protein
MLSLNEESYFVTFFFFRLRLHSLSRFWISSRDTESIVRTTASNF